MKEILHFKPSRRLRQRLFEQSNPRSIDDNNSAVVFAPHQDDETLGCGGTIITKRRVGTPVKLVFMTDGTTSHSRFVKADELCRMRNREAAGAAKVLGLAPEDIAFLSFPDGRLGSHHSEAVGRVSSILHERQPREVFVPYRFDVTSDHEATFRIVIEAARQARLKVRVCEYPVWFWNQWPWVSLRFALNRPTLKSIARSAQSLFGWRALREFKSGVFIRDHLDIKRKALAEHRSQMTELLPDVGWPTLGDVSEGEFLGCFFQDYEVFHCWESTPGIHLKPASRPGSADNAESTGSPAKRFVEDAQRQLPCSV